MAPVLRKSRLPSKINLNDEDWLHCAIGANLLENIDRERSKKQYENAFTKFMHGKPQEVEDKASESKDTEIKILFNSLRALEVITGEIAS